MLNDFFMRYKYVVNMPIAKDTVNNYTKKLTTKHVKKIFDGTEQILISPVFTTDYVYLFQPIFDFDGRRGGGVLNAYDQATTFAYKLKRYPFIFELTEDGVHVTFQIVLSGIGSLNKFREEVKEKTSIYSTLDVSSSIRDTPMFRGGSYRNTYTMDFFESIDSTSFQQVKGKLPLEVHTVEEWIELWEEYLFPKYTITVDTFLSRM